MTAYIAHPTLQKFHASDAWAKLVVGPFGSGKSVGCVNHLLREIMIAPRCKDGVRRSRILIARNSYRELTDTTQKTFEQWVPANIRRFVAGNMSYVLEFTVDATVRQLIDPKGRRPELSHIHDMPLDQEVGRVHAEIILRSLNSPADLGKLLSLEISGAWLNEAREFPRPVFDGVTGRLGRYPRKDDLEYEELGRSWIILDSNPCDTMHWMYRLFVEDRPEEFDFFHQPPGLSDAAENLQYLPNRYYERMALGKDEAWIDIYVNGQFGFDNTGKAIHPMFRQQLHVADKPLEYIPGQTILFGADYGLTPACAFAQEMPSGQVRVIAEIVTEDMGADRFGDLVAQQLRGPYAGSPAEGWGDPAGDQRSAVRDSETVAQIMRAKGIPIVSAPSNDPVLRQDALNRLLGQNDMGGQPSIIVSPTCKYLCKGLSGGYQRRRLNVGGEMEKYADQPEKNIYSHVCEALHYMLLGMGKGYNLISRPGGMHRLPQAGSCNMRRPR